jgi:hypothetical protein
MAMVEIQNPQAIGSITYTESGKEPVEFKVKFKDQKTRRQILKYLTKRREFWIPESSKLTDQYRVDNVLPTAMQHYFELALMELSNTLGIRVVWPEYMDAEAKRKLIRGV